VPPNPSHLYDNLLILRCQTGDEFALAELIAQYSPRLRFFLANLAGRSHADDLLQETWIDVYRQITGLENPAAFSAWLYRIARDRAYRHLRRSRLPVAHIDETMIDSLPADDDNFSPADAEHVRSALDRLPLHHREILVLRFIEDMSYDQIARVLAAPLGTIRSRLHHAKRALREKLELIPIRKELSL
jgi:RNA polymerase sigma-70 factor (ECF subfamily)